MSLLGFSCKQEARASLAPVKPFSFAYVTDVHLTTDLQDTHELFHESQLILQSVIKKINTLQVDFVVFGGDQVESLGKNESNWNLFLDVVQGLNCPWHFVLGDKDVTSVVDKMQVFGPDWKGKGIEGNTSYWSTDYASNVHLIGLDTSRTESKEGLLSTRQINWLKKDLEKNSSKFTIVFSHHPLLPPPPYDTGNTPWTSYILANAASGREVLGASPYVRLCLSGHIGMNKIQKEGNIYYVSNAALASYPCSFKVFKIDQDKIEMESYQIEYKAFVDKARKNLIESTLAYYYDKGKPKEYARASEGDSLDQNAMLPLYGGMIPEKLEKESSGSGFGLGLGIFKGKKKEQNTQNSKEKQKGKK